MMFIRENPVATKLRLDQALTRKYKRYDGNYFPIALSNVGRSCWSLAVVSVSGRKSDICSRYQL